MPHIFGIPVEQQGRPSFCARTIGADEPFRGLRPLGMGTLGIDILAKNPYSLGTSVFQKVFGYSRTNSILTIDLILLKPYFQSVTNWMMSPCWLGIAWP